MKVPQPVPLRKQTAPFDDPEWIFEIKHDGFRALAMIEGDTCRFVSGKNHTLAGYQELGSAVAHEVKARTAILDGELGVADPEGRTVFASMMQRGRHQVRYFAFDLLWLDAAAAVVTPESSLETDSAVSVRSPPLPPSSERKRSVALSACVRVRSGRRCGET
jgi:ATP-dependent DNA ligase